MKRPLLAMLAMLVCSATLHAEDWPGWRGPRLDGSSTEKNLPLKWTATENIAWKADLPGIGHSSPVVHGDHVFVTTCLLKVQKRVLLCLDRESGGILWQRDVVMSPLEPKHKLNSYASSTPATDGKHVYVSFVAVRPATKDDAAPSKPREKSPLAATMIPEIVVSCYDYQGNKVWDKTPGRFYSRHGFSSAPVLYKDMVIVNGDQDAEAFVVALDKKSGEQRWRIDRPNRTRSYCVPLIVEAGGKTQMVLSGSMSVASYDPDTGSPIWNFKGPTEQFVASLVYGDGLFFMTAGFPDYHNLALRPDLTGDITKSGVAWHESRTTAKKASYVPSPLFVPGYFYMMSDLGWLSCFESKTGKRVFMEQLGSHHSGSPVLADGRVYVTDDAGVTYVLKAGGAFDLVSRNPLGDECYSSPAVSQGQLFIRTEHALFCIGKK